MLDCQVIFQSIPRAKKLSIIFSTCSIYNVHFGCYYQWGFPYMIKWTSSYSMLNSNRIKNYFVFYPVVANYNRFKYFSIIQKIFFQALSCYISTIEVWCGTYTVPMSQAPISLSKWSVCNATSTKECKFYHSISTIPVENAVPDIGSEIVISEEPEQPIEHISVPDEPVYTATSSQTDSWSMFSIERLKDDPFCIILVRRAIRSFNSSCIVLDQLLTTYNIILSCYEYFCRGPVVSCTCTSKISFELDKFRYCRFVWDLWNNGNCIKHHYYMDKLDVSTVERVGYVGTARTGSNLPAYWFQIEVPHYQ